MVTRLLRRSFLPIIPFWAAVAAALALYLKAPVGAATFLALFVAAVAITLTPLHNRGHLARTLALVALAFLAGSLSGNREGSIPLLPPRAPGEALVAIAGRSLADSGETPSGLYRVSVEVMEVGAGSGGGHSSSQSWRGRGTLLYRSTGSEEGARGSSLSRPGTTAAPGTLLWGDRFRATARLWCPEDGGKCMLIADEVVMQPGALGVGGAFMTLRKNVRRHLGAALARLPGDVRALTGALVLGDRSYLGSETVDSFRRGGLSHVLALSGMHLGIVAGSLLLVLRRFFSERGAMVAALAVAWGYLLLVGPGASLLRAAMMFSLWALFRLLDRRAGPLNSLGLTFLFFALFAPERSGEVGFWFSFLALSGLLLAGPPLGRFLERWLPPVLATPIGVSAAAFLATAPLSLALFGFAAPAGIFASVILGPLVVLVLWGGLLLLSSAALGFLFLPGYWITAWLQSLLLLVVETAASGPPITVDSAAPASWATALLPLIAIAAIALRQLVREARFRRTVEEEALLA